MRKSKDKKEYDVDLTKPVDVEKLASNVAEDDCFGKEWDMGSKECPLCHDNEVCGILFGKVVDKKVEKVQEGRTMFLDKAHFSKKLSTKLDKAMSNGSKYDLEEVHQMVGKLAHTEEKVAIREWVKRFADEQGYIIEAGDIWKR